MASQMFQTITASYEVVTPLMLGGANLHPEFRLQSYANVVRWWWRFLALGRYRGDEYVAAFWDGVLFGWSAKPFGRKRVSFRLDFQSPASADSWKGPNEQSEWRNWSGINYLTAQGFKEGSGREAVKVGAFGVSARVLAKFDEKHFRDFHPTNTFITERIVNAERRADGEPREYETAKQTLVDAMALIGLAGGLGARSRRGFGSLAVRELKDVEGDLVGNKLIETLPKSVADYSARITKHLDGKPLGLLPRYTALSKQSKFEICASGEGAAKLMNEIGWAFQIYRSWGQKDPRDNASGIPEAIKYFHLLTDRRLGRQEAVSTWVPAGPDKFYAAEFTADHNDLYAKDFPKGVADNRSIFGLPHNYHGATIGWDGVGDGSEHRRASPLIIHFHKLAGTSRTVCMIATLPAQFIPDGAAIAAKTHNRRHQLDRADNGEWWKLLEGFPALIRAKTNGLERSDKANGLKHTTYTPETVTI